MRHCGRVTLSTGWPPPSADQAPRPVGARTEPFAIVALVCSLAGLAVCPPAPAIVGIVFGHIALGRIRRSGDGGHGMAVAGLVVGYVTVALVLLATVAIGAIFLTAQDRSTDHAVDSARDLGAQIQSVARREEVPPRSTRAVRLAVRESGIDLDEVSVGFFGGSPMTATRRQLANEGWHLYITSGVSGAACLTVPTTTSGSVHVTRDVCPEP
jgi:hypothetical protein